MKTLINTLILVITITICNSQIVIEGVTTNSLFLNNKKASVNYESNNSFLSSDVDLDIPDLKKNNIDRYALIIGNSVYKTNSDMVDIKYAINDAMAFKLYSQKILGIPEKQIYYLENAISSQMDTYIKKIVDAMQFKEGEGEFYIYYSGHGNNDSIGNSYIIPTDATTKNFTKYGIKLSDFYAELMKYPSKKVVVFLDACFSGGGKTGEIVEAKSGVRIAPKTDKVTTKSLLIFAASSDDQIAHEYPEKTHGLFTYFLLNELKTSKGNINYDTLTTNVKTNVFNYSNSITNQPQTPKVNISINNDTWKTWKVND